MTFGNWGPVSKDLFVELSGEPVLLTDYVKKEDVNENCVILPKKGFSDDEFNDNEIALLEQIVTRFKYCTANELINFTHKKDSPWYKTAAKHGVLELLESGKMTTTDIEIKLSELIEGDKEKYALYKSHKEFLSQSKSLKA